MRTPELPGQVQQGPRDPAFRCPQCGSLDQQKWAAVQEARLLPGVPYFLVTLTIPDTLRGLCKPEPAILYDLLLREAAGALKDLCFSKLGGIPGFTIRHAEAAHRGAAKYPEVVQVVAMHVFSGRQELIENATKQNNANGILIRYRSSSPAQLLTEALRMGD
jgi:hypothetical protein